jgi:hypothetical protein
MMLNTSIVTGLFFILTKGRKTMSEEEAKQIEERARAMGWVPKEEFKGDPEKWRDAKEFVERGENFAGINKENINRLTDKLITMESKYTELQDTLKQVGEWSRKAEERAYKKAKKEFEREKMRLKKELKIAAKEEDWDRFDVIETELDSLEEPEKPLEPNQNSATATVSDPQFIAWKAENTWYETDPEMTQYADAVGMFVRQKNPHITGKAFYDAVKEEVKKRYPERFENPNRTKPNIVDGGNVEARTKGSGKKTFADLPKEAQQEYEKFRKQFELAGFEFKKEEYLKNYEWEE